MTEQPPWALVGQDFRTGLGEDFKSGVRFCKFALRAKAGGVGGVCVCRQVELLKAGLAGRGVLAWPWAPDSPNVMGKCL